MSESLILLVLARQLLLVLILGDLVLIVPSLRPLKSLSLGGDIILQFLDLGVEGPLLTLEFSSKLLNLSVGSDSLIFSLSELSPRGSLFLGSIVSLLLSCEKVLLGFAKLGVSLPLVFTRHDHLLLELSLSDPSLVLGNFQLTCHLGHTLSLSLELHGESIGVSQSLGGLLTLLRKVSSIFHAVGLLCGELLTHRHHELLDALVLGRLRVLQSL